MRTRICRLFAHAVIGGLLAALVVGPGAARGEPVITYPRVVVDLQDSTGAPVTHGCFWIKQSLEGEAIYGELCDGPTTLAEGDGVADGTVAFPRGVLPPGDYILMTVFLPDGYEYPPEPTPFTIGTTDDVHLVITLPGDGDAVASLEALLAKVTGVGPGRSLAAKVRSAQRSLSAGDEAGACSALADFIHHVSVQSGKSLTEAQAAEFVSDANEIRAVIGCE